MAFDILSYQQYICWCVLLVLWGAIVYSKDHVLGCPQAFDILYNRSLHLWTLAIYMIAHMILLVQVQRMNQPTEFALSKMGRVLLVMRRLNCFLLFRAFIISLWLFLVFYENAEETYVPVGVLGVHLTLSILLIMNITYAVCADNRTLDERDHLSLGRSFYAAAFVEITISIAWFMFNVVDVVKCHSYYGDGI